MDKDRLLIAAMAEKCKTFLQEQDSSSSDLPQPLQPRHLIWMCDQVVAHAEAWHNTKLHRWIGFVQCGLMANRLREFGEIKMMFNEAKKAYGLAEADNDLADHLDPAHPFELDLGGQG